MLQTFMQLIVVLCGKQILYNNKLIMILYYV